MSAAFTPGPWRLSIEPYEDDPFPGKDFFALRLADDTLTGITEPANAHLISAAPELYAELQQFVNGVETRMIDSPADETLANITQRARQALAKARGETLQITAGDRS